MNLRPAIGCLAVLTLGFMPGVAFAQSVNLSRSILPDQPYTLIYPETMIASGEPGGTVTLSHPNAPLQCSLTIVPVEDTSWTAESALASLNDSDVVAGWTQNFPGFALGTKATTAFQSGTALIYDGTSTDSPMGVPLTIVHAETVDAARGYTLDCLFGTEVAAQARPIVDFIIANFSTRADAECCIGVTVDEPATDAATPAQ